MSALKISNWIEKVIDALPDGDYDSDDIMKILGRADELLRLAANQADENLHDRIMKELINGFKITNRDVLRKKRT